MNNEQYYDDVIAPKLKEIGDDCVKKGIPFLAVAEYNSGKCGHTLSSPMNRCLKMVMLELLANTAPNIDGFIIALLRYAKANGISFDSSIVLRQYESP